MKRVLVGLGLTLVLFAGCLDSEETAGVRPEPVEMPDWAQKAIFAGGLGSETGYVASHDHTNRTMHQGLSTPNFALLSHTALASPYFEGLTGGESYCGAVSGPDGDRRIGVVHSLGSDVAMSVLDVTDPSAIAFLGELVLPFAYTYDVTIFEDGRYAAIASNVDQNLEQFPQPGGTPQGMVPFEAHWRDACGSVTAVESQVDYVPYGYSTILVDMQDPARPVVTSFFPHGVRNLHSISSTTIDGERYVVSSGLQAVPCSSPVAVPGNQPEPLPDVPPLPYEQVPVPLTAACTLVGNVGNVRAGNLLSHFVVYTIDETTPRATLVPHGFYTYVQPDDVPSSGSEALGYDTEQALMQNGHVDATLQKHPITGDVLAYLADWDGGLIIARLDGEGLLTRLSTWGEANDARFGQQMSGNIHSAVPLDLRDGRHYTLTGQEVVGRPEYRPTGQIVLLDTTDPAAPVAVARWTLPVDVYWTGTPALERLMFSTHYPVMEGDTLFVPMYHGGVWAADASPENWPELPSLGVYVPAEESPAAVHDSMSPEVLEVLLLGDNTLLIYDGNTGAYTVRFDPNDTSVTPAAPYVEQHSVGDYA